MKSSQFSRPKMEIMTSQAVHMREPTSPNSPSSIPFNSAPTSPIQRALDASYGYESDYAVLKVEEEQDDFEFETSKKFETSPGLDNLMDDDHHRERKQKQRQRGGSMPTMTFADELFSNGLVLPLALKLPPRLQQCVNGSATPLPGSPAPTKFRFPRRRSAWNDEFDPFAVALDKVRDEEERRSKNNHRRFRSLSPFRTATDPPLAVDSAGGLNSNHQQRQCNESKSSVYGRIKATEQRVAFWKESETSEKSRRLPRMDWQPCNFNRISRANNGEEGRNTDDQVQVATRKHKVKEFLHGYAAFGREKKNDVKLKEQIAALWKGRYLQKKLSVDNSKENYQSKANKKACGKPKNTEDVAQCQPRLALCLSFHAESP